MANSKYITVTALVRKFNFDVLYKEGFKNKILIPSLNRTGIELASQKTVFKNIISAVLWSNNESRFLSQLNSDKERMASMSNVLRLTPPVIIVTDQFKYSEILLKVASKYKTAILHSSLPSAQLYVTVAAWINENLAEYKTLHGTLVSVYGVGVLLEGKSGVGKSEVAMELVKKGHIFVADDAVDVTNIADRLFGKPNAVANNFIEVRGLGILNIARMFGIEKTADSSNIDIIVELVRDDNLNKNDFERIGNKSYTKVVEKVKVSFYRLPITSGRKMSDLIETAVVDWKLKQHGYNSASDYLANFTRVSNKK